MFSTKKEERLVRLLVKKRITIIKSNQNTNKIITGIVKPGKKVFFYCKEKKRINNKTGNI